MHPLVMAASAIVPSLLLLSYFRSRDRNPEPGRVVWRTFLLGIAVVAPILVVGLPAGRWAESHSDPFVVALLEAVFAAALPEEFFKFVVVAGYAARRPEFDEPMDGIVYGAVASLGFATLENVLYVEQNGLGTAVMRAASAVPGHACTGAIMGYYVGRRKFATTFEERSSALRNALLVPMALHAAYDFPLMALHNGSDGQRFEQAPGLAALLLLATVGVLLLEIGVARRLVDTLRADQDRAALAFAPPTAMVPVAPPRPETHYLAGAARLLGGAALVTMASMVCVGLGALLILGDAAEPANAARGTTLISLLVAGVLPGWLGVRLFRRGLARLHGPAPDLVPPT